jgi:hypothetical protein
MKITIVFADGWLTLPPAAALRPDRQASERINQPGEVQPVEMIFI